MTFVVQGEVRVTGAQARSELQALTGQQEKLKSSSQQLAGESRKAASETRKLGSAASGASGAVNTMSAAERKAAAQATTLGRQHQLAAGQVGNLTAQFNDIGIMLAAGQNPLQLAIQQGTQITQVIGPMGAAGAAKALRAALVSMVNPVSLITIGSIAAGAAMVQWLSGASEEAESLEDRVEAMGAAIDAFGKTSAQARLSFSGMFEEFGTADPKLRAVLTDMAALGKIDAYQEIDRTADAVRDLVLELSWWDERSAISATLDFLGLSSLRRNARDAGVEFARNLETLSRSEEPAVKLRAALDLRDQLLDTAGGLDRLNASQREFYDGLAATIRDLILLGAKVAEEETAALSARERQAHKYYAETRIAANRQEASAREMLAALEQEAALREATYRFGADSAEVAELRANAERRALEQQLASVDASEDLKNQIRAVLEQALAFSNVDMSAGIRVAVATTDQLRARLALARGEAQDAITAGNSDFFDPRGRDYGSDNAGVIIRPQGVPPQNRPGYTPPKTRSSGGGAAIDRERQALERLLEQEQLQIDLLRVTDPLQRELMRNREVLATATAAERQQVEALIATRLREQEAVQAATVQHEFFKDTARSALNDLVEGGESLSDVMENVARAFANAALQAALFGDGPFGGLFGGGLFGALIPGKAEGGYLSGPGSGTSDSMLIRASSGEYVVNARATQRHRPLLEAINAGAPGFAAGGMVGGGDYAVSPAGPRVLSVSVDMRGGSGNPQDMEVRFTRMMQRVLDEYDRNILPSRVNAISRRPWRDG